MNDIKLLDIVYYVNFGKLIPCIVKQKITGVKTVTFKLHDLKDYYNANPENIYKTYEEACNRLQKDFASKITQLKNHKKNIYG